MHWRIFVYIVLVAIPLVLLLHRNYSGYALLSLGGAGHHRPSEVTPILECNASIIDQYHRALNISHYCRAKSDGIPVAIDSGRVDVIAKRTSTREKLVG